MYSLAEREIFCFEEQEDDEDDDRRVKKGFPIS